MDKEFLDKLKQSDCTELYEQAKILSSSLGISEDMLKNFFPSPEHLKRKLNSLSYGQLEGIISNLDENTLCQIKDALGKKGE